MVEALTPMTHNEKLKLMFEDLSQLGVSRWTFAPPIYRLLWKFGFEVPPPLFSSFGHLLVFQGGFFGFFWGLFMGLFFIILLPTHLLVWLIPLMAISAGFLFGLCMAIICRWQARNLKLPTWEEYERQRFGA